MYKYSLWPSAFSFKDEIGLFLEFFKEKLRELIQQIEETEKTIEK